MAALNPHPALKAAIEQASPADMFLGDDFHHNGAFRLSYGFEYSAMLETVATENYRLRVRPRGYLRLVSRARRAVERGREVLSRKSADLDRFHRGIPNYDAFWQRQAFAPYLTAVKVPILTRGGLVGPGGFLRTAEDLRIVGAARYRAAQLFRRGPVESRRLERATGRNWAPIDFGSDTGGALSAKDLSAVVRSLAASGAGDRGSWPRRRCSKPGRTSGRSTIRWPPKRGVEARRLYFREGRRLAFDGPGGERVR